MRELHFYDYVNQPYDEVRAALTADPKSLFVRATNTGVSQAAQSELRIMLGALELASEIEIEVDAIGAARSPLGKPATVMTLHWSSPRRPGWFPTMNATLKIYALTPTETQLDFDGEYQPPLGLFGAAVDTLALHRFAGAAVANFVRELAAYLRTEIGRRRDAQAAASPAVH